MIYSQIYEELCKRFQRFHVFRIHNIHNIHIHSWIDCSLSFLDFSKIWLCFNWIFIFLFYRVFSIFEVFLMFGFSNCSMCVCVFFCLTCFRYVSLRFAEFSQIFRDISCMLCMHVCTRTYCARTVHAYARGGGGARRRYIRRFMKACATYFSDFMLFIYITYIRTWHTHTYITYICMHIHACICMYMHAYTCMHAHACMHMHMHAYTCMHMHMHAYTCICMHMHAYAYVYMPLEAGCPCGLGRDFVEFRAPSFWVCLRLCPRCACAVRVHTCICMHAYVCMHMYACICMLCMLCMYVCYVCMYVMYVMYVCVDF